MSPPLQPPCSLQAPGPGTKRQAVRSHDGKREGAGRSLWWELIQAGQNPPIHQAQPSPLADIPGTSLTYTPSSAKTPSPQSPAKEARNEACSSTYLLGERQHSILFEPHLTHLLKGKKKKSHLFLLGLP